MPYCTECGNQIPADAKFCSHCGKSIENRESSDTDDNSETEKLNPDISEATDQGYLPDALYRLSVAAREGKSRVTENSNESQNQAHNDISENHGESNPQIPVSPNNVAQNSKGFGFFKNLIIGILVVLIIVVSVMWWFSNADKKVLQDELTTTQGALAVAESTLLKKEAELDEKETLIDNLNSSLETTEIKLQNSENQLEVTEALLAGEKSRINKMESDYGTLKETVNSRILLSNSDKSAMITLDSQIVSNKAQEITGGYSEDVSEYYKDCKRLYDWIVKNIRYSNDSPVPILPSSVTGQVDWFSEYWRTPEETLEDEAGDCEDMAILLASLVKCYNESKFAIWCIGIGSDTPDVGGHIAVAFPVKNGQIAILDPAGNYYTGQFYGQFVSESVTSEINKWLLKWKEQIPDARIKSVFTESMYEEFSSTSEFLDWFAQQ